MKEQRGLKQKLRSVGVAHIFYLNGKPIILAHHMWQTTFKDVIRDQHQQQQRVQQRQLQQQQQQQSATTTVLLLLLHLIKLLLRYYHYYSVHPHCPHPLATTRLLLYFIFGRTGLIQLFPQLVF